MGERAGEDSINDSNSPFRTTPLALARVRRLILLLNRPFSRSIARASHVITVVTWHSRMTRGPRPRVIRPGVHPGVPPRVSKKKPARQCQCTTYFLPACSVQLGEYQWEE